VDVHLEEAALLGMLVASAEVYKKECYGVLLGYRLSDRFIVSGALPYQSADRKSSEVFLRPGRRKVVESVLRNIPKYRVLGEFHSHPMFGDKRATIRLGPLDAVDMGGKDVQILVAINDRTRNQKWREKADGSISGTFGEHHLNIGAYYYPSFQKKGSPMLGRIHCPFVSTLDSVGLNGRAAVNGRRHRFVG
jgi:hypothetical protein